MSNIFEKYTTKETFERLVPVKNVPALLEKIENEYSDKVAVIQQDKTVTYSELCLDAKHVGTVLHTNGIDVKKNIGVIAPDGYEFCKCALGIMAYGSVATLLPVQLDEKSIYGCCMLYNLEAVFYHPVVEEKVQFAKNLLPNVKFIKIVDFKEVEEYKIPTEYNENIKPEDRSCIVLTSGTTGRSKGAILSHRALMQGVLNGTYGVMEVFDQVYYSIMPLTHVFGFIRNFLTCLYTGSKIFFCLDKKAMFKELQFVKPTILIVVPALAELFLNLSKQFGLNFLGGNLKTIICGGANVAPYLIQEFRELGVVFCAGYGLTESANLVSGNPTGDKLTSVGLLYPEQEIKLVNDELWIKGPNVMEGYYNNPEANALAFEDGWFKTGDLVRFDEEGFMYITGRCKDVIILSNGENISPAYIESKITELDIIQDALVYDEVNEFGAEILVCEVLLRPAILNSLNLENVQKFVENEISKVCDNLYSFERISKVVIRTEDFERSPSMKIIRKKRV